MKLWGLRFTKVALWRVLCCCFCKPESILEQLVLFVMGIAFTHIQIPCAEQYFLQSRQLMIWTGECVQANAGGGPAAQGF